MDLSNYYEQYWKKKKESWKPWFDPIIDAIPEGSNVLEVGCGKGTLLKALREIKKCKVTGVDIIPKPDSIDFPFYSVDIDDSPLPFGDNEFDYVISTEVLEHLFNPEKAIDEFSRTSSGKIIISIPNLRYIGLSFRILFVGSFNRLQPKEHIRFWTPKDFVSLLESRGVKVDKYEGVKMGKWGGLSKALPDLFSDVVVYHIKKTED